VAVSERRWDALKKRGRSKEAGNPRKELTPGAGVRDGHATAAKKKKVKRGPAGPQGPKGDTGAPGTARAYALVQDGALVADRSAGILGMSQGCPTGGACDPPAPDTGSIHT
jgi:hypothetical protein